MNHPVPSALLELPRDARTHYVLHLFAAVYRLLHLLWELGGKTPAGLKGWTERFPFLAPWLAEMTPLMPAGISWAEGVTWWERTIAAWEGSVPGHLPLRAMKQSWGLSPAQVLAVIAAGLPEEDGRLGDVFAALQEPAPARRPRLLLLGRLLLPARADVTHDPWRWFRPLVEIGVLRLEDPDLPRGDSPLRVPVTVWDLLRADPGGPALPHTRLLPRAAAPAVRELPVEPGCQALLEALLPLMEAGQVRRVVLRGPRMGAGRRAAQAVAARLDKDVLELLPLAREADTRLLGVCCVLAGALPLVSLDLSPGEVGELPDLGTCPLPLLVVQGPEGSLPARALEGCVAVEIPPARPEDRRQAWRGAAGGLGLPVEGDVPGAFVWPVERIGQVAPLAVAQAQLEGRSSVGRSQVAHAARQLGRGSLEQSATRLEADSGWEHLVVGAAVRARLEEVALRCRHREQLSAHVGAGLRGCGVGVRALFAGGSGTGKTLAARILAGVLGMDLYRVDLGAVVNKYIGETEKNLHALFAAAEEHDVVLLLDEGDSLLGRRTEVRGANDRYANLETNYLLQRLETHQGVVLITTNLSEQIDPAFQRRMDVVVQFLAPQAPERLAIWKMHLPQRHQVGREVLEEVAQLCALTGGQIRNAALLATLLALDDGGRPISGRDLRTAVELEYRKAGASSPMGRERERQHGGMNAFLSAYSRAPEVGGDHG